MKVAAILSLAAAAVGASAADSNKPFGLMALRSGTADIHFQSLNANGGQIVIGKEAQSYCPQNIPDCKESKQTSFITTPGSSTASLNVVVPGGQALYVAKDGALSFTVPHSGDTQGGSEEGFKVEKLNESLDKFTYNGKDFLACPKKDAKSVYEVYAADVAKNTQDCLGFSAAAVTDANATAVWEYN